MGWSKEEEELSLLFFPPAATTMKYESYNSCNAIHGQHTQLCSPIERKRVWQYFIFPQVTFIPSAGSAVNVNMHGTYANVDSFVMMMWIKDMRSSPKSAFTLSKVVHSWLPRFSEKGWIEIRMGQTFFHVVPLYFFGRSSLEVRKAALTKRLLLAVLWSAEESLLLLCSALLLWLLLALLRRLTRPLSEKESRREPPNEGGIYTTSSSSQSEIRSRYTNHAHAWRKHQGIVVRIKKADLSAAYSGEKGKLIREMHAETKEEEEERRSRPRGWPRLRNRLPPFDFGLLSKRMA